MKGKIFFVILFLSAISQAAFGQKDEKAISLNPDTIAADSTRYELIVFDPGFETWFLLQSTDQHSPDYYKARNRSYVSEWNRRYMSPMRHGNLYDSYIDYDPLTDYGPELERKLYYYFKFFEEANHVDLSAGFR